MKRNYLLLLIFTFLTSFGYSQGISLVEGYKMDADRVGIYYLFSKDQDQSVFVINHDSALTSPFDESEPGKHQIASVYGYDNGDINYLFTLDGDAPVNLNTIGFNEETESSYLLAECGQNMFVVDNEGDTLSSSIFVDTLNTVLINIKDNDSIYTSTIHAPRSNIFKITPFGDLSILSGVFRDTLKYTEPSGLEHVYYTDNSNNGYLIALNSLGVPQWTYFSDALGLSFIRTVKVDPLNELLYFAHDVVVGTKVIALDSNGAETFNHSMDEVSVHEIDFDHEGNMAWCGNYDNFGSMTDMDPGMDSLVFPDANSKDAFILKFDQEVKPKWFQVVGGGLIDTGTNFDFDEEGGVYLTGCIQSNGIFGGGQDVFNAKGLEDVFLAHYTKDGIYDFATTFGGNSSDIGLDVKSVDKEVFLFGLFRREMDIDPSSNEWILVDENPDEDESYFWARFESRSLSNNEVVKTHKSSLYPNPSQGLISSKETFTQVTIYKLDGNRIHQSASGKYNQYDLSFLPNGTYIVQRRNEAMDSYVEKIQIIK